MCCDSYQYSYISYMNVVTIADLKNKLSAYLRRVRVGESILVLDRDRPVARIEPVTGEQEKDSRLTRLESSGLIRRPTNPVPLDLLRANPPRSRESVLEALLEERLEGR